MSVSSPKKSPEIEKITHQVFNASLIAGTLVGTLAFIPGPIPLDTWYSNIDFISNIVFLLLLFAIYFLKKRIPVKIKSVILLVLIFGFFITDLLVFGVYSFDKVIIVLIPLYSVMVYSLRSTIYLYLISMVIFLSVGFLFTTGVIDARDDVTERLIAPRVWIESALILTAISVVMVVMIKNFRSAFTELIKNLEHNNRMLAERDLILENEKNFTDKLLSIIPGIFYLYRKEDNSYKLYKWNYKNEAKFGYNVKELEGMQPFDFFSQAYHTRIGEEIKKLQKTGFGNMEAPIQTKNGEGPWYHFEGHSFTYDHQEFFLGVGLDISKRKKAENKIANYNQKLQDIVRARTEELEKAMNELHSLNASLEGKVVERTSELQIRNEQLLEYAFINSHLLRAPLARLIGLSDLISRETKQPEDKELWSRFIDETKEFDQVVRKISDLLIEKEELDRKDIISSFGSSAAEINKQKPKD